MKGLVDYINEGLKTTVHESSDADVWVVKDPSDGTIITVCDSEDAAKKAADEATEGKYEIIKDKKSNYIED